MARTNKHSAGILGVHDAPEGRRYFLVHPGGPFFAKKDAGAWSVPKGLVEEGEEALEAARRELAEETGFAPPGGPYVALGEVTQKGGKRVEAWAVRASWDASALVSGTFEMQWPPRSERRASFPEVDRGAWFTLAEAREKILAAQAPFLERAAAIDWAAVDGARLGRDALE